MENVVSNVSRKHTAEIIYGESMEFSGVENVDSYDSEKINMRACGTTLLITGEELEILLCDAQAGKVSIKGKIQSMAYGKAKQKIPFFKRIFK